MFNQVLRLSVGGSFAQRVASLIGFLCGPLCIFCGLCVEMTVKPRERRDTQRTAEETPPKTHFCKARWRIDENATDQTLLVARHRIMHRGRDRIPLRG